MFGAHTCSFILHYYSSPSLSHYFFSHYSLWMDPVDWNLSLDLAMGVAHPATALTGRVWSATTATTAGCDCRPWWLQVCYGAHWVWLLQRLQDVAELCGGSQLKQIQLQQHRESFPFHYILWGNNKIICFISDSPSDGYSKDCRM